MRKEYSIYRGEKEIFVGTIEECMKHFNVKRRTVQFWACPANHRMAETGKKIKGKTRKKECSGIKVAVRLWK